MALRSNLSPWANTFEPAYERRMRRLYGPHYKYDFGTLELVDHPIIKDSTNPYVWGGAIKIVVPHPGDIIFTAIRPILDSFNGLGDPTQSLQGWADPLQVQALSASPTSLYQSHTSSAVHLLTRHQTYIKVQLRLAFGLRAQDTCGTVMVLVNDHLEIFEEWLKRLPSSKLTVGKAAYELQYDWWRTKGKVFRFFDLPTETRDKVMLHILGSRVKIHELFEYDDEWNVTSRRWSLTEDLMKASLGDSAPLYLPPTEVAIFHVSKAVKAIARRVLWEDTTKVFNDLWDFDKPHLRNMPFVQYLRSLELSLTCQQYMNMFNMDIALPPHIPHARDAASTPDSLRKLPNLRSLTIDFHPAAPAVSNLWAGLATIRSVKEDYPEIDWGRPPCQTAVVEWILAFAYEYIRHVPKIRLTGFIAAVTRKKWQTILNDKSPHDYMSMVEAEKKTISRLPLSAFPPRCCCKSNCGSFLKSIVFRCTECSSCDTSFKHCHHPHNAEWAYGWANFDIDDDKLTFRDRYSEEFFNDYNFSSLS